MNNKTSENIPITELIWGADVANILGVSIAEFHRRLRSGKISGIRAVPFIKGRMFSLYDALKVAHPRADDDIIELLVFKFRQEKVLKHPRSRLGGKK